MGPVIKVDLFGYQSRPFKKLAKNIDDIKYVALRESWFWNLQKLDQEEERAVIGKHNKLRLGWRSTETEGPFGYKICCTSRELVLESSKN